MIAMVALKHTTRTTSYNEQPDTTSHNEQQDMTSGSETYQYNQ